jgi:hypothetical protein
MTDDVDRRLEISLRLKAARWLRGHQDGKGKAVPLSTRDLTQHPALRENRITQNRIEEIEQMRTTHPPRRMELEQLEHALDLPGWFISPAEDVVPMDLTEEAGEAAPEIQRRARASETARQGPARSEKREAGA